MAKNDVSATPRRFWRQADLPGRLSSHIQRQQICAVLNSSLFVAILAQGNTSFFRLFDVEAGKCEVTTGHPRGSSCKIQQTTTKNQEELRFPPRILSNSDLAASTSASSSSMVLPSSYAFSILTTVGVSGSTGVKSNTQPRPSSR